VKIKQKSYQVDKIGKNGTTRATQLGNQTALADYIPLL